jgi:hypothetical protein
MFHTEMHEWFDYLHQCGVIDNTHRVYMRTILDRRRASVHAHAMAFAHRAKDEHPDLWIAFQTVRRITTKEQ